MASKYRALVPPQKSTTSRAGMCLQFAQSFFGAPVRYRSAWHAWLATKHRHGTDVPLPDKPVLLWFSHWGRYNDGQGQYGDNPRDPYWGNWGHVAPLVPGDAIYTSPWYAVQGREKYQTIAEIERIFGAKYVGWSEDINGLRVAEPVSTPTPVIGEEEDDDMTAVYVQDAATKGQGTVFRVLANGRKRAVPTPEWNAIRAQETAAAKAGYPAPVIVGQMSGSDLSKIPDA